MPRSGSGWDSGEEVLIVMWYISTIVTAYSQSQQGAASRLLELLSLVCSARNMRWNCALVERLILCIPKREVARCKQFKEFKDNRELHNGVPREINFHHNIIMKSEVLKDRHTYRYTCIHARTHIHAHTGKKKEERKKKEKSNPCELPVRSKQVGSISYWKG